ncbi:hypothetical protein [Streptomyces boluensis]|uniref:Uncharacterized protein n=1 Tax=Streptomyces boluensis TaxID=1775135 RepID=A0A964V0S8_9ACTN|nr:hypothetical protein [Streptomyces boluensis]NBE55020.1 hypothetical protein [Streptomyces boluensis]
MDRVEEFAVHEVRGGAEEFEFRTDQWPSVPVPVPVSVPVSAVWKLSAPYATTLPWQAWW